MASQQQHGRDNTTHEREMYVKEDIVPKIATKFEELAKDNATGKGSTVVAVGVTDTREGGKPDGVTPRSQHEGDNKRYSAPPLRRNSKIFKGFVNYNP